MGHEVFFYFGVNVLTPVVGLGTEFRSEKIPRNRLGTVSVIPRKNVLIPRQSEFRGRANSEARNETERNEIPRNNEVLRNLHSLYDHSDGLCILEKISSTKQAK